MKLLDGIKGVAKYIGAVLVMLAIVTLAIAGGSEKPEAIQFLILLALGIGGTSLPFFTVALLIDEIIDRLED